ncbi:hypothetical protein [Mesorhizobium sp. M0847]|uniref:hypothetical protein n=1 Tax=unclassified Mesorhizobium TaxID=325217 RepID=UPI003339DC55
MTVALKPPAEPDDAAWKETAVEDNHDDLRHALDELLRKALSEPPPLAETATERRARELAKQQRDQKIRAWLEEVKQAPNDRKA